jgi:hypothetical protein
MKRGFAAQFGERFTRRLFGWLKFLSPQQAAMKRALSIVVLYVL